MTAPTRIGRYEIVRRLGKSMTDVYLAHDTLANRQVALKLIQLGGDAVHRLIADAERRGAAIQKELQALDPRMVEVYDFGDLDGYFYVAMQYVEGRNLAEVLRADKAMDATRAATVALEICEQLVKIHSCQVAVVHGDIKPSNIHLSPRDTVRLLDFGIAKTLRANGDATDHEFGSPGYCAPERLSRSQVDEQSDLWSVGATLYEMLAGAPPYQAENTRKLEGLIQSGRPPRALPARVPRALRLVVAKALAVDPQSRYAGAREFQDDLQAFLERRPTAAEIERGVWSPNATIEAARECLRKATQTVRRAKRRLQVVSGVAWFSAGMVLWIGGEVGWQALAARVPGPPPMPAAAPHAESPALYVAAADRIFANPTHSEFDWHKAELYLEHAVALGAADPVTREKLAFARANAVQELRRLTPVAQPVSKVRKSKTPARSSHARPTSRHYRRSRWR